MVELLIIADNLTGAIETGAQFSKKGVPTLVTYDLDINFQEVAENIKVLVLDTENRYKNSAEASMITEDLCKKANEAGIMNIYIYRDAILRGNIGCEFETVLNQHASNVLSYIPASPKSKLYTKKGYQYVDDTLLENSIYASDPSIPITSSYIPDVIKQQTKIKTRIVPVKRIGSEKVLKQKYKRILVFDCETSSDMRNIGKYLQANGALKLLAGAPGFAELLPELYNLHVESMVFSANTEPILLINGSLNRISLEQAEFARANGFHQVIIPPRLLYSNNIEEGNDLYDFIDTIRPAMKSKKHVVVKSVKMRSSIQLYMNQGGVDTVNRDELYQLVVQNTGYITSKLIEEGYFGNLVIFGGDTTLGILKAMGVTEIYPKTEIRPGLCYVKTKGKYNNMPIISKNGTFGQIDIILKLLHFLGSK